MNETPTSAPLSNAERQKIQERLREIDESIREYDARASDPVYQGQGEAFVKDLVRERSELERQLGNAPADPEKERREREAQETSRILTEWRGPDYEEELRRLAG